MASSTLQLALLMDYESLIGTFSASEDETGRISANDIITLLEKKYGSVVYRKAIADWSNPRLKKNAVDLQRYNVEMLHVAKVGHSARYAVENQLLQVINDCMLHYPAIDAYAISFGEGDFMPAVCRLKANGKKVFMLMADGANVPAALQKYCDEVVTIGERAAGRERSDRQRKADDSKQTEQRPPIVEAIRNLIGVNGLIIDDLYQQLMQVEPEFNVQDYGFDNFEDFLRSLTNYIKFSETEEGLLVVPSGGVKNTCPFTQDELKKFNLQDYMQATRWYIIDGTIRDRVLHNIFALLEENGRSMSNDELRSMVDPDHIVEDRPWHGTIFSLVYGACLWESPESSDQPLQRHRLSLHRTVKTEDEFLVRYYISLFHKAYADRPELTPRVCAELMHPDDVEDHIALYEQVLNALSQRH